MIDIHYVRENFGSLVEIEAYWHPLGHVECQIFKNSESEVRLHFWPKFERRPKMPSWPIHRHRFELESEILEGELFNILYSESIGLRYRKFQVNPISESMVSSLEAEEESCNLTISDIRSFTKGEKYRVIGSEIHQAYVNLDIETITLVNTFEYRSDKSVVFGSDCEKSTPYIREAFDRGRFWNAIGAAIAF